MTEVGHCALKAADQPSGAAALGKRGRRRGAGPPGGPHQPPRAEPGHIRVTDTGLAHLKGLTNLRELNLSSCEVTDAGLVHRKGLTKLNSLDLWGTQVTKPKPE